MMIVRDETRELPTEWTNEQCQQLVSHAMGLGHSGNPSGFLLLVSLHPFIGYDRDGTPILKFQNEWDYDGLRSWIASHVDDVKHVWQLQVKDF
jgi:hypothetical protein